MMANRKQPRGQCTFCGFESTKAGMTKHLAACPGRLALITQADEGAGKAEPLWYLRVQDAYAKDFWLDLEVRGSSTLSKLDSYLRAIWLECCGHMSQFSVGGWRGQEIAMRRRIDDVFEPDVELTHIYDFGTSSYTLIKAIRSRVGVPLTKHPIYLMARNVPPDAICTECGAPATHFCMECIYEEDSALLCEAHAATHPHNDYGEPLKLVNSPRLGLCGYTGPADPPY
jgi:hypothetical protein